MFNLNLYLSTAFKTVMKAYLNLYLNTFKTVPETTFLDLIKSVFKHAPLLKLLLRHT